jgi:hypothetical protein
MKPQSDGKGFEAKQGRNDITYLEFLSAGCAERELAVVDFPY